MLISGRGGISALSAVRPHAYCRYRFGHRKACKKVFVRIQTIRAVGCEFGRRQDYRLRLFFERYADHFAAVRVCQNDFRARRDSVYAVHKHVGF